MHGLWPDYCSGAYTQYCDLSRQYDPVPSPNTTNALPNGTVVPPWKGPTIDTFLKAFGRYDLIDWMNTYWVNQGAPNTDFWAHEFSKHATCFSTFDIPCYGPQYVEHEDVVDFFETTIKWYKRYPTWEWLNEAKIVPSNKTTYSLGDIEKALTKKSGAKPYIGCSGPRYNTTQAGQGSNDTGRTVVSEVWYFNHVSALIMVKVRRDWRFCLDSTNLTLQQVLGRPQEGNSVPVGATSNSGCAKSVGALHYYEPTPGSVREIKKA